MTYNRSIKLIAYFLILCFLVGALTACYYEDDDSIQDGGEQTVESAETEKAASVKQQEKTARYILNSRSKKIHKITCGTAELIIPENKKTYTGDIEDLFRQGYTVCGNCFR